MSDLFCLLIAVILAGMNKRLNEFRQHQYKQQFAAITPCASKTAKQYKSTINLNY